MMEFLPTRLDRTIIQRSLSKQTYIDVLAPFKSLCGSYLTKADFWSNKNMQGADGWFLEDAIRVELRSCYSKYFVRYTLFPARLTTPAFEAFVAKTIALGSAGYSNALAHGYLREFEIAVDFPDRHTKDYLFHRHGVRSGKHIKGNQQIAGTHYQGSLSSALQTYAYNKAEQMAEVGQVCAFENLMRIEARFRKRTVKLGELANLENPFCKLVVCSMQDLYQTVHPEPAIWKSFLAKATVLGVPAAMASFSPKYRQQFRAILKQRGAPWWKPMALMKGFPERAAEQLRLDLCN
ncbi:hypothetical protein GNZ12_07945 [Paraburkholderia sp. 1N]|uniref:Uncharacterized protein n=1 Tax=Paraburkholderia solitsugae TaxID=2675748 RepID=A0ABX2BKX0_9BURK|nr:hypothetical protein [Paraburkholderia solitsugae]NPT41249.1 hypothetical protein [Paraburkholderia solitsugae]